MAETVYLPGSAIRETHAANPARHSPVVRITHWLTTIAFILLVVSGFAIILAHPRFYWGETGGLGTPSLFDLPLPFLLGGPSGWGRYMHFEAAWVCVLTGLLYAIHGVFSGHFAKNLWPAKGQLSQSALAGEIASHLRFRKRPAEEAHSYNVLQRLSYLAVIFLVLPLLIWTGLAMSPAITSVFPFLVTLLGGQQTARTVHFFVAILLVLFFFVHLVMLVVAGFVRRTRAMISGKVGGMGRELP
jgi:thiosulfate reductase cytochrome b subunit